LAHKYGPYSEDALIALLRARDQRGMAEVYDRFSAALFGAIVRIVPAEEVAEEILQETFLKVWNRMGSYDASKGTLFTWMLNIARNSAIDHARLKKANQKNRSLDNLVGLGDDHPSVSQSPDTMDVRAFADKLPAGHKVLIDLVYFNGYTQAEAAEHLQIPLGTVKTRLRTALKTLRLIFE